MRWQWESREKSGREVLQRSMRKFWGIIIILIVDVSWGTYTYVKMYEIIFFKYIHLLYVAYTSKKLLKIMHFDLAK